MALATYGTLIDLRALPAPERGTLVFNTFRLLEPGQTLELVDAHELAPLFDQFQERSPGRFGWDYLERGPDVWRVRIMRLQPATAGSGGCGCGGCRCS